MARSRARSGGNVRKNRWYFFDTGRAQVDEAVEVACTDTGVSLTQVRRWLFAAARPAPPMARSGTDLLEQFVGDWEDSTIIRIRGRMHVYPVADGLGSNPGMYAAGITLMDAGALRLNAVTGCLEPPPESPNPLDVYSGDWIWHHVGTADRTGGAQSELDPVVDSKAMRVIRGSQQPCFFLSIINQDPAAEWDVRCAGRILIRE